MVRPLKILWAPVVILILESLLYIIAFRPSATGPWCWFKVLQEFKSILLPLCTPV